MIDSFTSFKARSSPSSRRAWIEIEKVQHRKTDELVALLAEGVDRNCPLRCKDLTDSRSPSSRRAWIEIGLLMVSPC